MKVSTQKFVTLRGRPSETKVSPKADRSTGSPKFEGVLLPEQNKNTLAFGTTEEVIPSLPIAQEQDQMVRKCNHGIICQRTDLHTHTGKVLKAYSRRKREQANKEQKLKKEKEKDPRDLRWRVCQLKLDECPVKGEHGHFDRPMRRSDVRLANLGDLTGKDGEEAIRCHELMTDFSLLRRPPWTSPDAPCCGHGCQANHEHITEEGPQPDAEDYYIPQDDEEDHMFDQASHLPSIEEEKHVDIVNENSDILEESTIEPIMASGLVQTESPIDLPPPEENLSKLTLPVHTEKERALEVLGESSSEVNPGETPSTASQTQHKVFIFTDNSGALLVDESKGTFWRGTREFLARHTFLVEKQEVHVGNQPGHYTLSEFRQEINKDIAGFRWFWQSDSKIKAEQRVEEFNEFGRRYTHVREASVYTVLVEYVLSYPALAARTTSLVQNGVVDKLTLLQIDQLISLHRDYKAFCLDASVLADTRCHLINQVYLRGLRAESMKNKTPGSTTKVSFQRRARIMDVSPHAPLLKSDQLMQTSIPYTTLMRASNRW